MEWQDKLTLTPNLYTNIILGKKHLITGVLKKIKKYNERFFGRPLMDTGGGIQLGVEG